MKRILLIIIFFYSTFAIGKNYIWTKLDTTKNEKTELLSGRSLEQNISITDTVNLELKSDKELTIPSSLNNKTKVVLVKEKSKVDFLKYLLPILSLLLGIWIKQLIDKKSNNEKLKKTGERWIAELRSLEEPLNKQIKSLQEFLIEHEKEEFNPPNLIFYSSLNGEVFKSLDKNELIKYIEKNNKKVDFRIIVKISNKIHGYISALVHLHESLKDIYDKFLAGISLHTTSLTKNLQSFNEAYVDYGIEIENETKDSMNDKRYKPIYDLYSAHIVPNLDDGNYNVIRLESDFFTPVIKILTKYRTDEKTKPLSRATTSCLNDIIGIRMEKKYMSDNTTRLIKGYGKLVEILGSIINGIKKH